MDHLNVGMFSSLTDLKNNARLFPPPFHLCVVLTFLFVFCWFVRKFFFPVSSFKNCGGSFSFRDDEHSGAFTFCTFVMNNEIYKLPFSMKLWRWIIMITFDTTILRSNHRERTITSNAALDVLSCNSLPHAQCIQVCSIVSQRSSPRTRLFHLEHAFQTSRICLIEIYNTIWNLSTTTGTTRFLIVTFDLFCKQNGTRNEHLPCRFPTVCISQNHITITILPSNLMLCRSCVVIPAWYGSALKPWDTRHLDTVPDGVCVKSSRAKHAWNVIRIYTISRWQYTIPVSFLWRTWFVYTTSPKLRFSSSVSSTHCNASSDDRNLPWNISFETYAYEEFYKYPSVPPESLLL